MNRNPEIWNTPVWVLPNIWRLWPVTSTKFGTNVSNNFSQGFSFHLDIQALHTSKSEENSWGQDYQVFTDLTKNKNIGETYARKNFGSWRILFTFSRGWLAKYFWNLNLKNWYSILFVNLGKISPQKIYLLSFIFPTSVLVWLVFKSGTRLQDDTAL